MWNKIPCKKYELSLLYTLNGGQCFRWKKTEKDEWIGIIGHHVYKLTQDDENLLFSVIQDDAIKPTDTLKTKRLEDDHGSGQCHQKTNQNSSIDTECFSTILKEYFRLEVSLQDLYMKWSDCDPHFKEAATKFNGIRIMNQDPVENVFSFICSSNNNITRISSMVDKLCTLYGEKILENNDVSYFTFPTIESLSVPGVEDTLRKFGFGYRAKFIYNSACKIKELGGRKWLENLKNVSYSEAKKDLMQLQGIGAKVADCICLMSLGHLEAIPVDTHIFQVASQHYLKHLRGCKSVTEKVYNEIGDHFRKLLGIYAGWAHTILFCADLKVFHDSNNSKRISKKDESKSRNRKRKLAS